MGDLSGKFGVLSGSTFFGNYLDPLLALSGKLVGFRPRGSRA
jgi:hypothetical protein